MSTKIGIMSRLICIGVEPKTTHKTTKKKGQLSEMFAAYLTVFKYLHSSLSHTFYCLPTDIFLFFFLFLQLAILFHLLALKVRERDGDAADNGKRCCWQSFATVPSSERNDARGDRPRRDRNLWPDLN